MLCRNLSEVPKGWKTRKLQWRRSSLQAGHATHDDLVSLVHLVECGAAPINVPLLCLAGVPDLQEPFVPVASSVALNCVGQLVASV